MSHAVLKNENNRIVQIQNSVLAVAIAGTIGAYVWGKN